MIFHEAYFRKSTNERRLQKTAEEIAGLKKKLERKERRISELKRLFMKVYEDNAAGRLNDERYEMLSQSYESEQKQLEKEIVSLEKQIAKQENQEKDLDQFIEKATKMAGLQELDGYKLHEMIDAIYVEAPDKSSGHRVQRIHIKYNLVGFIPIDTLSGRQTA